MYEVVSELTKKRFALKVTEEDSAQREYENNIKIMETYSNVCHPNITCLHEMVSSGDMAGLIFELMTSDLQLDTRRNPDGTRNPSMADGSRLYVPLGRYQYMQIVKEIVSGLSHIHKSGLAHLDIKPANMLYKKLSEYSVVFKIGDLGVSCFDTCDTMGTMHYTCPYLYDLQTRDTPTTISIETAQKCDMWSLAISFLEILFGQSPYDMDEKKVSYWKVDKNPKIWSSYYYGPRMQELRTYYIHI